MLEKNLAKVVRNRNKEEKKNGRHREDFVHCQTKAKDESRELSPIFLIFKNCMRILGTYNKHQLTYSGSQSQMFYLYIKK